MYLFGGGHACSRLATGLVLAALSMPLAAAVTDSANPEIQSTDAFTAPANLFLAEALNDTMEYAACGSTTPCNGWTHGSIAGAAGDIWAHGAPSGKTTPPSPNAHSGSNEWVTTLSGNYGALGADASMYLRTPVLNLAAASSATLTFWHYYRFEVFAGYDCDGGIVEISTNSGASWTKINPNGGYPSTIGDTSPSETCGLHDLVGQTGYGGTVSGWTLATFVLTSYVGSANTYIRYHFGEDFTGTTAGWYIDDVIVSYVPAGTPPTVTVTSPNGAESWVAQSTHDITWTVASGTNPLQANSAIISYSTTGCGGTFNTLATNQPVNGPYSWTLPSATTSSGCIRASVDDTLSLRGTDTSGAVFQVVAATPPPVSMTRPNGGESWVISTQQNLTWTAGAGSFPLGVNPITLSFSTTGSAGSYIVVATGLANSGTYPWTVPNAPSTNVFLKVEAKDDRPVPNTGSDLSDAAAAITTAAPPTVTVQQPNGGEWLSASSTYQVRWTAAPGTYPLGANPITIDYSSTGCAGGWAQLATSLANTGTYNWNVPATPNNSSCIRVSAQDDQLTPNVGIDSSNAVFEIAIGNLDPAVELRAPASGGYARGLTTILFNGSDPNRDTVNYTVTLSNDSGGTWAQIATASFAETPSPTPHALPFDTSAHLDKSTYRLRIAANDGNGSAVNVTHPADFTIDNTAPVSRMTPLLPFLKTAAIPLNWSSVDATAGLASVEIRVREGGGQTKLVWNATNVSGTFYGREGYAYEFWAIGWDKAGNVENKSAADVRTKVDSIPPQTMATLMPKYSPSLTVDVPFTYVDATTGKTTIWWTLSGQGQWAPTGAFNTSPGQVTVPSEGKFEFYAVGEDDAGNKETKPQVGESETTIDAQPPVGQISLLTPLVSALKASVSVDSSDAVELERVAVEWVNASDPGHTGIGWEYPLAPGLKSFSGQPEVTLPKGGDFLLTLNSTDRAGGSSRVAGGLVRVDVTPPTVTAAPDSGAVDVAIPAVFMLTFSEPVNRSSAERGFKLFKGSVALPITPTVDWKSDTEASVSLAGIDGQTAYTLVISPAAAPAKDIAGNSMAETRVAFTTVPTNGDLAGTVREEGGAPIRDAAITLKRGNLTKEARSDKAGAFTLSALDGGEWTVHLEARGFVPTDSRLTIVAGQPNKVDLFMPRDIMSILPTAIGGAVVAAVVLSLLVILLRKSRKCPQCANKITRKSNACQHCGFVVKKRSKLDVAREARLAREDDQRKVGAQAAKSRQAEKKAAAGAAAKSRTAPPIGRDFLAAATPVTSGLRPTNCFACGTPLKPEEEWCPKCHQAVVTADHVGGCSHCGGSVIDGACTGCGATVPEADETHDGAKCPRCTSPIPVGSGFCDQCGYDISKAAVKSVQAEVPITTGPTMTTVSPVAAMHAPKPTMMPPPAGTESPGGLPEPTPVSSTSRATPPSAKLEGGTEQTPVPESSPTQGGATCRTCGSMSAPGIQWCDGCGERLE